MLVTKDNIVYCLNRIELGSVLVVDTETTGLSIQTKDRLCGISILNELNEAFYFSFRHRSNNIDFSYLDKLKNIFDNKSCFIGFNYKFDMHALLHDGFSYPKKLYDVLLAAHLCNENEESFALKILSDKYIGKESSLDEKILIEKINDLPESKGKKKLLDKSYIRLLDAIDVEPYACTDVKLTKALYDFYRPILDKWSLLNLWDELNEYMLTLTKMENFGLKIDEEELDASQNRLKILEEEYENKIKSFAGFDINVRSPSQLKEWLKLPDVSKNTLKNTVLNNDLSNLILSYRVISKIRTTYIRKFKETMSNEKTIHCNFNITGTCSGRLSCSNPNLQALPRNDADENSSTEARNAVKRAIVSREGRTFIEADFSQLELRVAADLSDSKTMKEIFASGIDFHQATADKMNCTRQIAKGLNFAILYGAGAEKVAYLLKISTGEARSYLKTYFATFPELRALAKKAQHTATVRKYIRIFSGRIRHYYGMEQDYHKALNNLIQGSGAEACRYALQRIDKSLIGKDAQIVLTVHDSIVVETNDNILNEIILIVKECMENQPWCSVKLKADIKIGKRLSEMKKN